ncbi:MAG: hypothetical protein FWC60_07955 [Firmicutes bacterium]|nr:hypothetical protein [Bacillota bacterium]
MKYFLIIPDKRVHNPLQPDKSALDLETAQASLVYADFQPDTTFVDYLIIKKMFHYGFYVSEIFKDMLDIYADNLTAVPVFITDQSQKQQKVYWRINIEQQDCLVIEPQMHYENLTLKQDQTNNKYIFRVAFEQQQYLVVSLHLAENILRKGLTGIQFIPVNLQQTED